MASEQGEPGVRRPRWWMWMLAICWVAGTSCYWWRFVPAVPERVIPLKHQALAGHTADGMLVLAAFGEELSADLQITGPLEVVDPLSGQRLNVIGDENCILGSGIEGSTHVVLEVGDRRDVVELRTGRKVLSRPRIADDHFDLSKNGQLLAVASGEQVSMINVETGEQLWSREFREIADNKQVLSFVDVFHRRGSPRVRFQTSGRGVALLHVAEGDERDAHWLDGRTGKTDSRFEDVTSVVESPDCQYLLLRKNEVCEVFSVAGNRIVGRIPIDHLACSINQDSTEVRELSTTPSGVRLSRWSLPEGRAIGAVVSDPEKEPTDGLVSEDGRAFVTWDINWGLLGSSWLAEQTNAYGLANLVNPLFRTTETVMQHHADGRRDRLLAQSFSSPSDALFPRMTESPIGRVDQFVVTLPDRLLIFRFDPPRDWWWLVAWGLGPVAVVMGVSRWRVRRRGMRHMNV